MAIVTRYFSTTAAGAADGTTWADRAALFSTGNWSSVITGFAFNGSDSLECRIGPGTYTCSQSLAPGLFANAPTQANPLILHGADSSGNRLAPSNPGWVSAQPVDWDSELPVIATTTNIVTVDLGGAAVLRLLKFTASGRNGSVLVPMQVDWCYVSNSTSNTSAAGITAGSNGTPVVNSYIECTGSSYAACITSTTNAAYHFTNLRITGVVGSSGTRRGINISAFAPQVNMSKCTVFGVGGDGVNVSGQGNGETIANCVFANCGGDGVELAKTTSTIRSVLTGLMVTGNGGYGVNVSNTATGETITNSRLRDNTSGNFNGFGNYPTDLDNYVTDSDDATDYADAANGDFRIKLGSTLHGKGYGAGDQPNTASGGRFGGINNSFVRRAA